MSRGLSKKANWISCACIIARQECEKVRVLSVRSIFQFVHISPRSIGLFRFDLVAWLFGGQTATVSRVIYTLVGLSALWCVSLLFRSDAIVDDEM